MNLRNVDLNLLVILDALLNERSVTRAASRLNLTQPAVSQALARARTLFSDPLLIRDGMTMVPTRLAETLSPRLGQLLADVQDVLSAPTFDPATSQREFTVTASDLGELIVVAPLIVRMSRVAPGCSITVYASGSAVPEGVLDLAIVSGAPPDGSFSSSDVLQDHFVLLARHGHPVFDQPLTPESYAAQRHARVYPWGKDHSAKVDLTLAQLGLRRQIVLRLSNFMSLPTILASSDLVAAVPLMFASRPVVQEVCKAVPLPIRCPPVSLRLYWHPRHDVDPGHVWLRNMITGAMIAAQS